MLKSILLGASLTVLPLSAMADEGRITVSGSATVYRAPDLASISLGGMSQEVTAAEAMAKNSTVMRGVIDRLKEAGIEDRLIQTSGLSLSTDWTPSKEGVPAKISSYSANNTVKARVTDLTLLGPALDAAVKDGANQLNGVRIELAEPAPALNEARKLAVQEARAKAELIAETAGVKLGKIIEITEGGGYGGDDMPRFSLAEASSPFPVQQGEVSYSATVNIVWEIKQ